MYKIVGHAECDYCHKQKEIDIPDREDDAAGYIERNLELYGFRFKLNKAEDLTLVCLDCRGKIAKEKGFNAAVNGGQNPYQPGTLEYGQWKEGYTDAGLD
jgi:hypothetical protein